jgi:hypothetical protein
VKFRRRRGSDAERITERNDDNNNGRNSPAPITSQQNTTPLYLALVSLVVHSISLSLSSFDFNRLQGLRRSILITAYLGYAHVSCLFTDFD